MNVSEILRACDHTLLTQTATWDEIRAVCDDAVRYGCASVCIPPSYVAQAADYLGGRVPVCTVIGFPNGYATTAVKCYEAADAVANGASEIDMVVNLGWVRDGRDEDILAELRAVRAACPAQTLKVIIETCLLTEAEKLRLCDLVTASGADFIKTSTGFAGGGATPEDVALLRAHVGSEVQVKAAGGIADLDDAANYLALGAARLGTSRVVKAVKAKEGESA
jgi:deoxyribose-phosphate aldolase